MSMFTMWRRIGIAVGLVLGPVGAAMAAPILPPASAIAQLRSSVIEVRVRVPRGILGNVPSGGDPYIGSRPILYPVPPVVVIAPVPVVWPVPAVWQPSVYEFAPIDFGPCFVPTEHTSQLGYYGSCLESYFRQYYFNRPD